MSRLGLLMGRLCDKLSKLTDNLSQSYGTCQCTFGLLAFSSFTILSILRNFTKMIEVTNLEILLSEVNCPMSHFNGLGALKAVLIIGTDYRKIDNILYRY